MKLSELDDIERRTRESSHSGYAEACEDILALIGHIDDISKAKADALREAADALDTWHSSALTGDRWDNGFVHAVDMILGRADEMEGK